MNSQLVIGGGSPFFDYPLPLGDLLGSLLGKFCHPGHTDFHLMLVRVKTQKARIDQFLLEPEKKFANKKKRWMRSEKILIFVLGSLGCKSRKRYKGAKMLEKLFLTISLYRKTTRLALSVIKLFLMETHRI